MLVIHMENMKTFKVSTQSSYECISETIEAETLNIAKRKVLVVAMENLPSEAMDEFLDLLAIEVNHTEEYNATIEKELRAILKNMESYAKKNNCEFKKKHVDYRNEDHIIFSEYGFYLEFVVNWYSKTVDVLEEVSNNFTTDARTISFGEFWKFQNHFLNGA